MMPVAGNRARTDLEAQADLGESESFEVMQFEHACAARLAQRQMFEGMQHLDGLGGRGLTGHALVAERDLGAVTAALECVVFTHMVTNDLVHRACGESKKMLLVVNDRMRSGEFEVGLVHQGVGWQWHVIAADQAARMAMQLLVQQRKQGAWVQLCDGGRLRQREIATQQIVDGHVPSLSGSRMPVVITDAASMRGSGKALNRPPASDPPTEVVHRLDQGGNVLGRDVGRDAVAEVEHVARMRTKGVEHGAGLRANRRG